MLDLLWMALLNIFRNRRRTVLTLASMMIGVVALSHFGGFIEYSFLGLRESIIRSETGHFQIRVEGYRQHHVAEPERYMIEDPGALLKALRDVPELETAVPRLRFSGLASTGQHSLNVRVIGIDVRRGQSFADFETILEGRPLRRRDQNAGLLGGELAQGLNAGVGDWVTVLASTLDGTINALDFEVVGIVTTGSKAFDEVYVKVPLAFAQTIRDTDKVEEVLVLLDTDEEQTDVAVVADVLAGSTEGFEITLWSDEATYYHRVVSLYNGLFRVFSVIMAVVVMFSVANTVTMSVFERTSEVGALRAIGATRGHILAMFLAEGFLLGLLGMALGIVVSLVGAEIIAALGGIPMPPPPGRSTGFQAQILLTPTGLMLSGGLAFAAAVLSSISPALSASRLNIVEAIEHA